MKKRILVFVAIVNMMLMACGDDSSTGTNENFQSSSWSEESNTSSSSKDYLASSSSLVYNMLSSSSNTQMTISSSSLQEFFSSSAKSIESSSSSQESSSSEVCVDETVTIPSKLYDCNIYDCVSTAHLNPNIDYGELLDTRDNKVYRTVKIGSINWMAQNLDYRKSKTATILCDSLDCDLYGTLYNSNNLSESCPEGWRVASEPDYFDLENRVSSDYQLMAKSCIWEKYDWNLKKYVLSYDSIEDVLGFALLPAGEYNYGLSYNGCAAYQRTLSEPLDFGYCKSYDASRISDTYMSVRCVEKNIITAQDCSSDRSLCAYGTLKDERDGQTYKTIKLGNQEWMAQNLNFAAYEDTLDYGASSCPSNSKDSCAKYGRLYNRLAAWDTAGLYQSASTYRQGICPEGWHLPSDIDWEKLSDSFTATSLSDTSCGGTDLYGFSALKIPDSSSICFWSSDKQLFYEIVWSINKEQYNEQLYRKKNSNSRIIDWAYCSIRCIKDE